MTGTVLRLDTYRREQHLHIDAGQTQHVYPADYFRRFVSGAPVEPIPADVQRVIVREWLQLLEATD